jgi:hypothetical protein
MGMTRPESFGSAISGFCGREARVAEFMTLQTQENPMEKDIWTAAEMDGTAGAPKQSTLVGEKTRTNTSGTGSGSTGSVFDRIERD